MCVGSWHRAPSPSFLQSRGSLRVGRACKHTHQRSGRRPGRLQVLAVNPAGGKVNKSPPYGTVWKRTLQQLERRTMHSIHRRDEEDSVHQTQHYKLILNSIHFLMKPHAAASNASICHGWKWTFLQGLASASQRPAPNAR